MSKAKDVLKQYRDRLIEYADNRDSGYDTVGYPKKWDDQALTELREGLLAELPREKFLYPEDHEYDWEQGYNQCRQEVREIINNYFGGDDK